MRRAAAPLLLALLAPAACHPGAPNAEAPEAVGRISAQPVEILAKDGAKVPGVYTQVEKAKALVLLFHQADSSKDEYALIAPRLAQAGYASLRIDQRSGGDLFGGNAAVRAAGKSSDMLSALPDLEGALAWASDKKLPVILWGSSYSASLIFLLAAAHPQGIAGLVAFSPGEYFDDPKLIQTAAAKVRVPVFIDTALDGKEIDAGRVLLDTLPGKDKQQFVPKLGGVHGASTLMRDRNPAGAEENWRALLAFLRDIAPEPVQGAAR